MIAATLLVRGTELTGLTLAILGDAPCARAIVTAQSGAFSVRGTRSAEGAIVSGASSRNFTGRDRAETTVALLVRGAELIGFTRAIFGNHATGAGAIVTAPGAALLVRVAGLPNRLVGGRTGPSHFTACNLAEGTTALLVGGAELVRVTRAVRTDATGAGSVVATSRATLLVRAAGLPDRLIGGRTGSCNLPTCDLTKAATALLVSGAELVGIARSILGNATGAGAVVAASRATLLMRGAGLPVWTIPPCTDARHLAAGHITMCSAALLMRRTELVGIARAVDRHTARAGSVIATPGTTFLMRGTSLPNRAIDAGALADVLSRSHVAERAAALLVSGAELVRVAGSVLRNATRAGSVVAAP